MTTSSPFNQFKNTPTGGYNVMRYIIAMVVLFALMVSVVIPVHHVVTERGNTTVVTEPTGRLLYGPGLPPIVYFRMGAIQMSHPDNVYDCAVNSVQIGGDVIFHAECIALVYGAEKAEELVAARGPNAPTPEITHLVR
jgi:hypothetical protein